MMPPLPPPRDPQQARQSKLEATLLAQVNSLMMNAQRYEMRAAVYASLGEYDKLAQAMEASDHFAAQAFSCINQVLGDLPAAPPQPLTLQDRIRAEFPDATAVNPRPVNPEAPDADEAWVEVYVDHEGKVITNPDA